jgi:hypothetical protein
MGDHNIYSAHPMTASLIEAASAGPPLNTREAFEHLKRSMIVTNGKVKNASRW